MLHFVSFWKKQYVTYGGEIFNIFYTDTFRRAYGRYKLLCDHKVSNALKTRQGHLKSVSTKRFTKTNKKIVLER